MMLLIEYLRGGNKILSKISLLFSKKNQIQFSYRICMSQRLFLQIKHYDQLKIFGNIYKSTLD
ncbi:hypothetical protein BpHYR1_038957 [Brachionus plicatilis]|uniref:Uncharacterized protein n=1 Tax=Brachionus plicatilis TaxID=10195 RepID=A0A3M7QAC3_BRAPC|nr:hypothetical protein BpHYR1_038957 [Brachionus plicatilis]